MLDNSAQRFVLLLAKPRTSAEFKQVFKALGFRVASGPAVEARVKTRFKVSSGCWGFR